MVCGTCGATIAEKAIVCYRCGAPTAIPETTRPGPPPARTPWGAVVLLLAASMVMGYFALESPRGSMWQVGHAVIGAVLATAGGYLAWRRPR